MNSSSPRRLTPALPRRLRSRGAVVGVVGLVLCALLGSLSGVAGALLLAGLYVMACGVWAVLSRRTWVGRTTRKAATGVLAGGFALVVVGTAVAEPVGVTLVAPPTVAASPAPTATREPAVPAPTPTSTPTAPSVEDQAVALPAPEAAPEVDVAAVGSTATPRTALATAMLLTVKGRAPRTGYDRDLFGSGWVDVERNGCDTRNDMLARDLEGETFRPGTRDCVVLSGTLADPYSGRTIPFLRGNATSTAVQIDHVVALSDAWQKGAQAWDDARRTAFANDPMNLLAVDGPLNLQKGDGDTATWLPPHKPYRCAYVARQVGVKYTYGLWVTDAEQRAMVGVLSTCPDQPLPAGSTVPPESAAAAPAPAPAPAPVPGPAPAPAPVPAAAPPTSVHYENCTAARAAGAAPVRVGDPGYAPHLDRDDDGVGCES